MSQHSPTPWRLEDVLIVDATDEYRTRCICEVSTYRNSHIETFNDEEWKTRQLANAEHIVRCVNAWDDLQTLRARVAELAA